METKELVLDPKVLQLVAEYEELAYDVLHELYAG